jgi:hypothetical protein
MERPPIEAALLCRTIFNLARKNQSGFSGVLELLLAVADFPLGVCRLVSCFFWVLCAGEHGGIRSDPRLHV